MIYKLNLTYYCLCCGSDVLFSREVVIDDLTKKIEITCGAKCVCGNRHKSKFKLMDVTLIKKEKYSTR